MADPKLETSTTPVGVEVIVPGTSVHDAILPVLWNGVKWAIPNLGDNQETENASLADLFALVNRYLQGFTSLRDCFVPGTPSIECVKAHHNMYVRINQLIDAGTKKDNEFRVNTAHVTPVRRKFRVYMVRYYDQKNQYTVRWTELALQALSEWAQLANANTWTNDWSDKDAVRMKRLFQEAYRHMAITLFGKTKDEVAGVYDSAFFLTPEELENYHGSDFVPDLEWMEHPGIGMIYTEDELRPISTPDIPVGKGVPENEPPPDRDIEQKIHGTVVN